MNEDYTQIRSTRGRRVATITLDRPDKLNAITPRMAEEVRVALAAAEKESGIRVVVLKGSGRAFSAGFDLSPRPPASTSREWRSRFEPVSAICRAIWDLDKPVLAQVQGVCLGAAFDIAMACDLVICADDASFGEPEIRFGGTCQYLVLPWLVGMKTARYLLLTGDTIDARQALAAQLVNQVVPLAELESAVDVLCRKLALHPEGTLTLNKRALNRAYELMGLAETVAASEDRAVLAALGHSEEAAMLADVLSHGGLKAGLAWLEARLAAESQSDSSRNT
jgi:enoyl-CoA hydratase/carnithine racemase